MRLLAIEINGYKSLRSVTMRPSPLSVLVGPNAAGKSNFCDALDFLGEVYRLGLGLAVARKGGYENICFRKRQRSRAPIRFHTTFEVPWADSDFSSFPFLWRTHAYDDATVIFDHTFQLGTQTRNIQAPFSITYEALTTTLRPAPPRKKKAQPPSAPPRPLLSYSWNRGQDFQSDFSGLKTLFSNSDNREFLEMVIHRSPTLIREGLPDTELLLSPFDRLFGSSRAFMHTMGSLRVFQLTPKSCREPGVPTPSPQIDRFGNNLPALVEHLKTQHPERYALLLSTVRTVLPTLKDLQTQYTPRKTLALSILEEGFGRPWSVEDVSDGTIQTIAMLAAVLDPRTQIVVLEEPENSIHPWALRQFVRACRHVSAAKQVILTTHSPVLIDRLQPKELWLVSRPHGQTLVQPILDLDPDLAPSLGEGHFTLSQYLDSGELPDAVPGK